MTSIKNPGRDQGLPGNRWASNCVRLWELGCVRQDEWVIWGWVQKWESGGPGAALFQSSLSFPAVPSLGVPAGKTHPVALPSVIMLEPCRVGEGWSLLLWSPKGVCFAPFSDWLEDTFPGQISPLLGILLPHSVWGRTRHNLGQGPGGAEQTSSPARPASLALIPCSCSCRAPSRTYTVLARPPFDTHIALGVCLQWALH